MGPKMHPFSEKVVSYIRQHGLIAPGERVLAAFSGGADSTAMVLVLSELAPVLNFTLETLHVNHKLRGAEAERDEAFCRDTTARMGLPFHRSDLDPVPLPTTNVEEHLRERRHQVFARFLRQDFQRLALGHTIDDRAETFLLRLARGAGLEGLGCMPPATPGGLIRPLLGVRRAEALAFLAERGQPFCEDSSNADLRYERNRVRRLVLPELEQVFHPAVAPVVARTAGLLHADSLLLRELVLAKLRPLIRQDETGVWLAAQAIRDEPESLQVHFIREAVRLAKGDLRRLQARHFLRSAEFIRTARSGRTLQLPGPFYIHLSQGTVWITSRPRLGAPFAYSAIAPAEMKVQETGETFTLAEGTASTPAGDVFIAHLPDATVICRSSRPGDLMKTPGGTKKLKKIFQEKRIPRFRRVSITVVTDSTGRILWIPALGCKVCYNKAELDLKTITIVRQVS